MQDTDIRETVRDGARRLLALGIAKDRVTERLVAFLDLPWDTVAGMIAELPATPRRPLDWTPEDRQRVVATAAEVFGLDAELAAHYADRLIPHFASDFDLATDVPSLSHGVYRITLADIVAHGESISGLYSDLEDPVLRPVVTAPKEHRLLSGYDTRGDAPVVLLHGQPERLPLAVGDTGPDFAEVAPHLIGHTLHADHGVLKIYRDTRNPERGVVMAWSND